MVPSLAVEGPYGFPQWCQMKLTVGGSKWTSSIKTVEFSIRTIIQYYSWQIGHYLPRKALRKAVLKDLAGRVFVGLRRFGVAGGCLPSSTLYGLQTQLKTGKRDESTDLRLKMGTSGCSIKAVNSVTFNHWISDKYFIFNTSHAQYWFSLTFIICQ